MKIPRAISVSLACCLLASVASAGGHGVPEDDELQAVIILCRHGVRAPIGSEIRGSQYNAQPWPSWPVAPGVLTGHGAEALKLLGQYYRSRYLSLLPKGSCEHPGVYVEANTTQRTMASAKALLVGLAPDCPIEVRSRSIANGNPLFTPASNRNVDREKLAAAINGRLGGHPEWFTAAFAGPLARMSEILGDCGGSRDCEPGKRDLRTSPARIAAANGREVVSVESPVSLGADFAEHFLLQYTEGMPMEKVGWGRVSPGDLDRLMEMNTRFHDFIQRTPYYAQVAASNLAERIRATVERAALAKSVAGALGEPRDRVVLLVGHDGNLAWMGGLLRLDWLLPDQTFNATPPGGGLVFEVRRNRISGKSSVQVFFVSQTLNQMRNLTPLTDSAPPSVAPVFVPGCSGSAAWETPYACSVDDFSNTVKAAIDSRLVETPPEH